MIFCTLPTLISNSPLIAKVLILWFTRAKNNKETIPYITISINMKPRVNTHTKFNQTLITYIEPDLQHMKCPRASTHYVITF